MTDFGRYPALSSIVDDPDDGPKTDGGLSLSSSSSSSIVNGHSPLFQPAVKHLLNWDPLERLVVTNGLPEVLAAAERVLLLSRDLSYVTLADLHV